MATTLPLFLDLWVKGLTWTQWGPLLYVKLKLGSKLMMLRSEETCPPFFSTGFIWERWSEEDDQLFPDCGLVVWVPYQHVQGPQPCDRWGKLEKDPETLKDLKHTSPETILGLLTHIPCLGKRFFPSELGRRITSNTGDLGLISGSERSLAEGNGNPLQYPWLKKISWTEESGGLQSMRSQKTWTRLNNYSHTHSHTRTYTEIKMLPHWLWKQMCVSWWGQLIQHTIRLRANKM